MRALIELTDTQIGQLGAEPIAGRPAIYAVEEGGVPRPPLGGRHVERVRHRARRAFDVEWRDTQRCVGGVVRDARRLGHDQHSGVGARHYGPLLGHQVHSILQ